MVGGVVVSYYFYRRSNDESSQTNSTQPASDNAQGYARVNNPNGTAIF